MVQQTKDPIFIEYGLAHAESALANSDKQLSVPVAAKKSELQDLRNESSIDVSKSVASPSLMKDSEVAGEEVKISGTKRPMPECLRGLPKINAGSGHIVYVRRKPETDLVKSNIRDTRSDAIDCPHLKKSTDDGTPQQLEGMNVPVICASDAAPIRTASSPSFSSTRRSVSPSLGISSNIASPENTEHVHLYCANPSSEDPIKCFDRFPMSNLTGMLSNLRNDQLSSHWRKQKRCNVFDSLTSWVNMERMSVHPLLNKSSCTSEYICRRRKTYILLDECKGDLLLTLWYVYILVQQLSSLASGDSGPLICRNYIFSTKISLLTR